MKTKETYSKYIKTQSNIAFGADAPFGRCEGAAQKVVRLLWRYPKKLLK